MPVTVRLEEQLVRQLDRSARSEGLDRTGLIRRLAERHVATARPPAADYKPKTALGRRLLALRKAHLRAGGKLLSDDEISREVARRRGEAA